MLRTVRQDRDHVDIWPGFVDVLASLLMIIVFLLTFFLVAQYFLTKTVKGQNSELDEFRAKLVHLSNLLNLEKDSSKQLAKELKKTKSSLQEETTEKSQLLEAQKASLERIKIYENEINALREGLESEKSQHLQTRRAYDLETQDLTKLKEKDAAVIQSLTKQVEDLSGELKKISTLLSIKEEENKAKETEIQSLGEKLNRALLQKVEELETYRSEFFGKLKEILKNQTDILIQGDRFVLQSEVLFPTGSAILNPEGESELTRLAQILREIVAKIPHSIPWILRVDGHTDKRPIRFNLEFKSNWELSAARALSVVHFLIKQGIPAQNLAATGFGEFHPIEEGDHEEAYRRNRRIEFKLTNR